MNERAGNSGRLFVLSGPSGVGKDSVIARLKAKGFPLHYAVTATTRPKRAHEENGVDYHFLSPAAFTRMRDQGDLLEWAEVHGNYYGTPRRQVRDALATCEDVLLKIDVQGAATIRRSVPGAVLIFLAPPSTEELVSRLNGRGTESADQLSLRLRNAEREMADLPNYDYVVINRHGRLEESVAQIEAIIIAERCRVHPRYARV